MSIPDNVVVSMRAAGSVCSVAIAAGAGQLLWMRFRLVVSANLDWPTLSQSIGHLAVMFAAGSLGLMLAIKAAEKFTRNEVRVLFLALQIAALLVPLLSVFGSR